MATGCLPWQAAPVGATQKVYASAQFAANLLDGLHWSNPSKFALFQYVLSRIDLTR